MTSSKRIFLLLLLSLILGGTSVLAPTCAARDELQEQTRRIEEGGLTTPALQDEALAAIASMEQDMGGLFQATLQQRMAFHQTPAVSVALIHRGKVEWVQAYGRYDGATGIPLLRSSHLQAGSLSKPVTALAIMQLVDAGLVSLDAPLNDALQAWQVPENGFTQLVPPTLRRVLSHTAGFNVPSYLGYAQTRPIPTLLQVLDGLPPAASLPVRVERLPGLAWVYSGGGYTTLAQVVEDVTGEGLESYADRQIFSPLNMGRSTFQQPFPQAPGALLGSLGGTPIPSAVYPELPAAGLWTTARDMGRFVVGLQDAAAGAPGSVLSPQSAALMMTPEARVPFALSLDSRMGLGLFLSDGADPSWFWHTGGNLGFTCLFVGDTRGNGDGAVVMTNSFPSGRLLGWEIVNALADIYGWPDWNDWGL